MNKTGVAFTVLTTKIAEGDVTTVRNCLLNKHCTPNDADEDGQTLLMIAAQHGQVAILNELLAHGADVNAEDVDNWSALTNAAKAGFKEIVIKLLDHGAELEHRDMGQWTPLMWAAYKGHFYIVKILLEHGASVNVVDKNHCTALIWAAGRGFLEIVEALLERGAKVYSSDKYGTTPLVWACRKGYTEIVPLLLDAGANVDTAGMFSWTPLLVAARGNYASIVNMLLEHKPNVNAVDIDGCTALSIACKDGYTEIAKALMNAGAYINLTDRNGDTNLIHASKAGHFSIVDALIRKYADIDLAGQDGKTALYWAIEKGYVDIVRLILSANPNIETATKDGDTALLKATRNRNSEIVQLLVDKKCRVSSADKKGDTALHIAMRARSKAIVEMILRNPKHSQLLYRPNRAGETPYNIDANHQRSILTQIFGARRLNTNEDSEYRLGYDLYSSALADILSEPSLSVPISVGLYAKWGSGKSFLLRKLENEMKSFALQWFEPMFEFNGLVYFLIMAISLLSGFLVYLSVKSWAIAAFGALSIFLLVFVVAGGIIYANKRYDFSLVNKLGFKLGTQLNSLKMFLFVVFCSPPAHKADGETDPVRFIFTDKTKVTSTESQTSVLQIVTNLHIAVEKEFGLITSRIYQALKPKTVASQRWKFRTICCIPNCFIAIFLLLAVGCISVLLLETDAAHFHSPPDDKTTFYRSTFITLLCSLGLIISLNLYTVLRIVKTLVISHERRLSKSYVKVASTKYESCTSSLKKEVDDIVQMVQGLDAFVGQQSRIVVIVDGLDSCEQDKVLYLLDAVHNLFSDANAPFVTVLAIDPHIVIKAIESNIHKAFQKSSISGYEYLRNVVHLPFYLQSSGLRRVKAAQQASLLWTKKTGSYWNEDKECGSLAANRKASNSSMSIPDAIRKSRKGNQKLKASESVASSISNLHRVVTGAQDLNKVLLTDDYFSDINPRSMRRLMNILYITGRLLKAFNIEFNWYHLASWLNITEQWPYRTSWIIMYYEMHENEFDEMLPVKTVYEKIKSYMPVSKEQESTLELDHDEKKFEVLLSMHSSTLLINDLKMFLPFTINLDPYIRKVIQETHQQISEFLKSDLKPSSPSGKFDASSIKLLRMSNQPPNPEYGLPFGYYNQKDLFQHNPLSPVHSLPSTSSTVWAMNPPHNVFYQTSKASTVFISADQEKLSSLSVTGISDLLRSQEKLNKKKLDSYIEAIEDNNINGQVLSTCDLKELKDTLKMSFGDWELFRVLILNLREHEMDTPGFSGNASEEKPLSRSTSFKAKKSGSFKGSKTPEKKPGDLSSKPPRSMSSENTEVKTRSSMLEKQITMEESMIVGALETLNEEALEDTLEDKSLQLRKGSNPSSSVGNPLSPILSDPEEFIPEDNLDLEQMPIVATTPTDCDIIYYPSLQNSSVLHVSAISLSDSLTDCETASLSNQRVAHFTLATPPLLRAKTIDDYESTSTTSSPLRKLKSLNMAQRPSSLSYDRCYSPLQKYDEQASNKLKSGESLDKLHRNSSVTEKSNAFHQVANKIKQMRRKSASKSESSDSSTETEEKSKHKNLKATTATIATSPTPCSDGDGFFSDDEHTPLVSPFHHLNKASHYNLQSSKPEKENTPEKSIPKSLGNRKQRKSLERQFSMDSNLCDHARHPPSTSTSMVEIATPTYVPILPSYGQNISDPPTPDLVQISSILESHNETVL